MSRRHDAPYGEVSLAAIDDTLAASALFGHLAGAFTDARHSRQGYFASTSGGTLFLDEIGRASAKVQAMLLRVLETGEVLPLGADRSVRTNARIVVASNVSLDQLVDEGSFLPDLRDRLGLMRIHVPPLRDRREDIVPLARQFVHEHARRCGYRGEEPVIGDDLSEALASAEWPGNVRQLRATIIRILVEAMGDRELSLGHCSDDLSYLRRASRTGRPLDSAVVRDAIARTGSKSAAARALGVSRQTVHNHLRTAPGSSSGN
jgi:DNA-binding NtrC family response regulator